MVFSSWRTWSTGETVTAAHMNQEVRDNGEALFPDEVTGASWSPTLEGTTTDAAATTTGVKYRIGALQFVWVRFVITSAGSGAYFVTLPNAASGVSSSASAGEGQVIGSFMAKDDSAPYLVEGSVILTASDEVRFRSSTDASPTGESGLEHDNPWTWAADDVLSFHAVYPIA